jgi:hypothetical protein
MKKNERTLNVFNAGPEPTRTGLGIGILRVIRNSYVCYTIQQQHGWVAFRTNTFWAEKFSRRQASIRYAFLHAQKRNLNPFFGIHSIVRPRSYMDTHRMRN